MIIRSKEIKIRSFKNNIFFTLRYDVAVITKTSKKFPSIHGLIFNILPPNAKIRFVIIKDCPHAVL